MNAHIAEDKAEQRALEFLAAEYERDGKTGSAHHIRTQPLLPNKARAVRAIAAALRQQQASRSWWTRCEPNTDLGDANAEIGFMLEDWQKVGEALGFTDFVDPEVIIAAITALRQPPAPVDLDATQKHIEWVHATLRENGCCIDGGTCHHRCEPKGECFRQRACVPLSGSRLTDDWKLPAQQPAPAIIDNAGNARGLYRCVECDDHYRVGTPCDCKSQPKPAPVVDDARMARALEWVRAECGFYNNAEARTHLPAIEEAIAAYDPACGARTVRVVDDAMGSLARATLARAQGVRS